MDLARSLAVAGDLLLGARCLGCDAGWLGLCPRCRAVVLRRLPGPTWPNPTPAGCPLTVTTGPYADELRAVITAHKEDSALLLTPVLGQLLAGAVEWLLAEVTAGDLPVLLVPVPSSAAAVRRRGFDATGAMARSAARRLRRAGWPVSVGGLLAQRRAVADQAGLSAAARAANLRGRLRLVGRPRPGWVVLVDDVVTTGASLTEAARVLQSGDLRVLGAATVAATQRTREPRRHLAAD